MGPVPPSQAPRGWASQKKSLYCLRIFGRDRNLLSIQAYNAVAIGNELSTELPVLKDTIYLPSGIREWIEMKCCSHRMSSSVRGNGWWIPSSSQNLRNNELIVVVWNIMRHLDYVRIARGKSRRTGYDPTERCFLGRGHAQWILLEIAQQYWFRQLIHNWFRSAPISPDRPRLVSESATDSRDSDPPARDCADMATNREICEATYIVMRWKTYVVNRNISLGLAQEWGWLAPAGVRSSTLQVRYSYLQNNVLEICALALRSQSLTEIRK